MNRHASRIVLRLSGLPVLLLLVGSVAHSAPGPVITFRQVFKGSSPEFIEIHVGQDGTATYDIRQLNEPPGPLPLTVNAPIRERIFQLAGALHNFDGVDLNVHRHVAFLGLKTFRYQNGAESHETTFNYTTNRPASELLAIFQGLAQQQEDVEQLEKELKYDPLGVNDALLQVESDLSQRALAEPDVLLPVLDRIANNSQVINLARERARSLAERIRTSDGQ